MGASLAFAGMTGCRWPKEEILPFADRPEGYGPGTSMRYATAVDLMGSATGLLVTAYDGRPLKVEGNPEAWSSLGATNAWHQATILEMYDPERSQYPTKNGSGTGSWQDFEFFAGDHFDELATNRGRKLRVLAEPGSSPTREAMRRRFAERFPEARWYEYTPLSRDNVREGARLAFGRPLRPHLSFDRATTILSIDDDFLTSHPATVRYTRDFADGRKPDGEFSRLWVVESRFSLTGSVADRRMAVRPSQLPGFVTGLAAALFLDLGVPLPDSAAGLRGVLEAAQPDHGDFLRTLANELAHNRGH